MIIELGDYSIYEISKYPAGEMQVSFKEESIDATTRAPYIPVHRMLESKRVFVVARLTDAAGIMELALLLDAIYQAKLDHNVEHDGPCVVLVLPYLPYSRADRPFRKGDCHGLRTFLTLINAMHWDRLVTLDVHNEGAARQYCQQLDNVAPVAFIERAIVDFAGDCHTDSINVLFPDEGASKRYKLPAAIRVGNKTVFIRCFHATKNRDANGVPGNFQLPSLQSMAGRPILIVDDLCDGGRTFTGLAKLLEPLGAQLALYVTHGIFSYGMRDLNAHFQAVYTTDSFRKRDSTDTLRVSDCSSPTIDGIEKARSEWVGISPYKRGSSYAS